MHLESFQSFDRFRYSFEGNGDFGAFWNLLESYVEINKAYRLLNITIDRQITFTIDRQRAIDVNRRRAIRENII